MPLVHRLAAPPFSPLHRPARSSAAIAPRLRRMLRRVRAALTAAAFAEESDPDTARRLAADEKP
jgi:hypothetical protein